MTLGWPRLGRCGACGRPATALPSGWWHERRPCPARSQLLWKVDDIDVLRALVFVPDGEDLPPLPDDVRDRLAREAEETT